ncbi:hypothetical protein NQD34_006684 [Periophthalmus magnuspinnatus]|nr:hypothetical protein NQD34_006684 [Periophthalmus magnuspinnatus]
MTGKMIWCIDEEFDAQIYETDWTFVITKLFIAQEGVAASCDLTPSQLLWYRSPDAVPHVSLALSPRHQAKGLGPMVKRLLIVDDWKLTENANVLFSQSQNAFQITSDSLLTVTGLCERCVISRDHGREMEDHERTDIELKKVPDSVWSQGPHDVGHCSTTPDVTFKYEHNTHVYIPQYRHKSQAAAEGIDDTLTGLWEAGVLEVSDSSYNTPLLPVPKKEPGEFRAAHDLRAINDIVVDPCPPVPDPYRMLQNLTPRHQWFIVIDLANAFFCLPLHPEVRHLFAFTHKGCKLQYTRLPQGFKLSPGIFNQCLKVVLSQVTLPDGVVVMQYVDDILIAAPTPELCLKATVLILQCIGKNGLKASRKKLQCFRKRVEFLGRVITGQGSQMSPKHQQDILQHPKPVTVKHMLTFLGLCGYSRSFVPDYSLTTQSLRAMIRQQGMRDLTATLEWTDEANNDFLRLKQELAKAAALATPDSSQPFWLDCSVSRGTANGVLYQKSSAGRCVLLYVSTLLEPTETKQPFCVQMAAGVVSLIQKTDHIVMSHPLHVVTNHTVVSLVQSSSFTMSSLRQTHLLKVLEKPHLVLETCLHNMADSWGTEGTPHDCSARCPDP